MRFFYKTCELLLIALGAGGKDARLKCLHVSYTYQTTSMNSYAIH